MAPHSFIELLNRYRAEHPSPDALARTLSEQLPEGTVAAGYGNVPVLAEHTHYFPGFALMLTLPLGLAVGVRPATVPHIVWHTDEHTLPLEQLEPWRQCLLTHPLTDGNRSVEGHILGPQSPIYAEGFLGSLAALWHRVLFSLAGQPETPTLLIRMATQTLQHCLERPFGPAPVLTGLVGTEPRTFYLLDTETLEYLSVTPEGPAPAWALLDTGVYHHPGPLFFETRKAQAEEALKKLQEAGFENLHSWRQLTHADLLHILPHLPPDLIPVVRHLVTENHRVQRMVLALRKGDWQMVGGLMLISQASLQLNWKNTSPEVDFIIQCLKEREGIYGARMVGPGFGGQLVALGHPLALTRALEDLQEAYHRAFGRTLETALF